MQRLLSVVQAAFWSESRRIFRTWLLVGALSAVTAGVMLGTIAGWASEGNIMSPGQGSVRLYTHWDELPSGALRTAFEQQGSLLINNLNLVATENGKPVLIRGGGFTQAGLDWLIRRQGVRTIIDLRGRFSDDSTEQLIMHAPSLLTVYDQAQLKNLSPEKTEAYVRQLAQQWHMPLQYLNLKAEDPRLPAYLDAASPQSPVAMFCQWGINRSGTAWGVYAAYQGWSFERALNAFGVKKTDGSYRNRRDIEYGYNLERNRLKKPASVSLL